MLALLLPSKELDIPTALGVVSRLSGGLVCTKGGFAVDVSVVILVGSTLGTEAAWEASLLIGSLDAVEVLDVVEVPFTSTMVVTAIGKIVVVSLPKTMAKLASIKIATKPHDCIFVSFKRE